MRFFQNDMQFFLNKNIFALNFTQVQNVDIDLVPVFNANENKFYALGGNYSNSDGGKVYYSNDGINWTYSTQITALKNYGIASIGLSLANNATKYVIIAFNGSGYTYTCTTSDFNTFTTPTRITTFGNYATPQICYGNGVWVAINVRHNGEVNKSWKSTNGTTYSASGDIGTLGNVYDEPECLTFDGTNFLVITRASRIYKSYDSSTWELYSTISDYTGGFWCGIIKANNKYVAFREYSDPTVYTASFDLINWIGLKNSTVSPGTYQMAYGKNKLIVRSGSYLYYADF